MPAKKKKKLEKSKNGAEESVEGSENLSESISSKKVIYIEIDDEVTAVCDKIKKLNFKHVYIVVPKRAVIFQSVVNLKILKSKAEKKAKTIYFITNDSNGINLAQQVGITVYNKANTEGKPAIFSPELDSDQIRITPLKATVNSVEDEAPTRLNEKKVSISQILKRKRKKNTVNVSKGAENKAPKKVKSNRARMVIVSPNRHALIGLSVLSVFILLVIAYVALPGATIYVTPAASVIEKSVNITLADHSRNAAELSSSPSHMIASYPIEKTVTKSITHFATGKKFSEKGANASGTILITNTSETVWPLVATTRFQTEEGIVFRITDAVTVPAASSSGPGTAEAYVVADQKDAYGGIVGERGNIGPSRFFLPGLRESSRSKIYGESAENMTGGVTDFIEFISEEDVEAAKSRIVDEVIKSAVEELKGEVALKSSELNGAVVFKLLEGENAVETGEVSVDVDESVVGKELKEFTVSGSVSARGIYYNNAEMLEILREELIMKKSPQKELLSINEDSSSYRVFDEDAVRGKIKLTANIKGIEQFDIEPDKDSGQRLLGKIRDHIVGRDVEAAKIYIQNLPEINKVEIESWPFWAPTIPNIADNIEFDVRDAVSKLE